MLKLSNSIKESKVTRYVSVFKDETEIEKVRILHLLFMIMLSVIRNEIIPWMIVLTIAGTYFTPVDIITKSWTGFSWYCGTIFNIFTIFHWNCLTFFFLDWITLLLWNWMTFSDKNLFAQFLWNIFTGYVWNCLTVLSRYSLTIFCWN